jgi:hypothetical protein
LREPTEGIGCRVHETPMRIQGRENLVGDHE